MPPPHEGTTTFHRRLRGWDVPPLVGIVLPREGQPGWTDATFWWALLQAWGIPFERLSADDAPERPWTTLILPAPAADSALVDHLLSFEGVSLLVTGPADGDAQRLERHPGVTWFGLSVDALEPANCEHIVDAAFEALTAAAPKGLIAIWRWPNDKDVALVVDGDVDHPTGVEPECARYVQPSIETATRAGFQAYGIFAAAAAVDAEPASFPPGADYYNHSYTHPYSHWNPDPWESLDEPGMREELTRSNEAFRRRLGTDDHGLFRIPHFQTGGWERTHDVLEELGYLAESSVGANMSITGGLPFHPARRPWSERPEDAAYARTHPDPSERRPFLQLPISTDPTDPAFPNGCCSYNTLAEGVRNRTADPIAYERVLQEVLDRATARKGLAHLFIDPPDAGFGRLPGDAVDYASAVQRWLSRAVRRHDVAVMTTARLARWWLARERAVERLAMRIERGALVLEVPDSPEGMSLAVLPPASAGWQRVGDEEVG